MKVNDVQNLWAPWRMAYLTSLDDKDTGNDDTCFLCRYWQNPAKDREQLVLWRTPRCMVLFNRYPYTGGHILIAPKDHVPSMDELSEETMLEMLVLARDVQRVLRQAIKPQGFNVGMNISRCAGAGLPDHLHMHVVPRWSGDTNFMSVCGDVRVISQSLDDLYDHLRELSAEMSLPSVGAC